MAPLASSKLRLHGVEAVLSNDTTNEDESVSQRPTVPSYRDHTAGACYPPTPVPEAKGQTAEVPLRLVSPYPRLPGPSARLCHKRLLKL